MPLGAAIHNIEITFGKGGQLARAAGAVAKRIAKEGKSATLRLPSGEVRLIPKNCLATVGQVGNVVVETRREEAIAEGYEVGSTDKATLTGRDPPNLLY